jgi:hypothetical protein
MKRFKYRMRYFYIMTEVPQSRPIRIDDLFDEIKPVQNKHSNINHMQNNNIQKNQKEFGNRKRIKP